jgi:hypothetical protein
MWLFAPRARPDRAARTAAFDRAFIERNGHYE